MEALALQICTAIKDAGGLPYYVGGYVRDYLRGVYSRDIDIEVFGLEAEKLESVLASFGEVNFVGKQYGCYKVKDIDVTLPRRDKQVGDKHTEVEAIVDIRMPMTKAARRRDLTINAIYMDPFSGAPISFNEGITDLKRDFVLRCVDPETFAEDPLRAIRAARFKAIMPEMSISFMLINQCVSMKESVATLPKERIFGELVKVLMEAPLPSIFFKTLYSMGLLETVFPEVAHTMGVYQGKKHHYEGSVYNHTLMTLDVIPVHKRELDVMLALLYHDLGKLEVKAEPSPDDPEKIHFKGHAEALDLPTKALKRVTNDADLTNSVLNLIKNHMRPYDLISSGISRKRVKRLALSVDIEKLVKVHYADKLGRGNITPDIRSNTEEFCSNLLLMYKDIADEIKPLIQGRDLIEMGYKPGPDFGAVLKKLFELQLDEVFTTKEEAKLYITKIMEEN